MVNIAKKKLPTAAISVIVYLSYCAMSWFSMRGTLAYLGQQYGIGGWFANDAWAFFLGGLIPFLLYEVFTSFVFKMTAARAGGDIKSLQYGLNYAVIAANLLLFALKFMYIALPLYAAVIDIIIDPPRDACVCRTVYVVCVLSKLRGQNALSTCAVAGYEHFCGCVWLACPRQYDCRGGVRRRA